MRKMYFPALRVREIGDRMLTHIDENGNAVMVDVTDKKETARMAKATGRLHLSKEALLSRVYSRYKSHKMMFLP